MNLNDVQFPRIESVLLLASFIGFQHTGIEFHSELNLWLATVVAVLSIDHYFDIGIVRYIKRKFKAFKKRKK